MTTEEINIAIAEACPELFSLRKGKWCYRTTGPWPGITYWQPCLQAGINTDLNAMRKAEETLKPEQRVSRVQQLCIICDRDYGGEIMPSDVMSPIEMTSMFLDCTARQRAEAFLRTLGKWKE